MSFFVKVFFTRFHSINQSENQEKNLNIHVHLILTQIVAYISCLTNLYYFNSHRVNMVNCIFIKIRLLKLLSIVFVLERHHTCINMWLQDEERSVVPQVLIVMSYVYLLNIPFVIICRYSGYLFGNIVSVWKLYNSLN